MPSRSLRVSVGWLFGATGLSIRAFEESTGAETEGLPGDAGWLESRLFAWADLVHQHYTWVDDVDATRGWRDEDARRRFVVEADDLGHQLRRVLGSGWDVHVSPEPGVTVVGLAGEHSCRWPLWLTGGLSSPESFPMLSSSMIERLERWADLADPDHYPGPKPDVTETLRRDLARELGGSFRVVA